MTRSQIIYILILEYDFIDSTKARNRKKKVTEMEYIYVRSRFIKIVIAR